MTEISNSNLARDLDSESRWSQEHGSPAFPFTCALIDLPTLQYWCQMNGWKAEFCNFDANPNYVCMRIWNKGGNETYAVVE